MLHIREVKTGSGGRAIQVVYYRNRKRVIVKHVGTAHSDADFDKLTLMAGEFIKTYSSQLSFFPDANPNAVLYVDHCQCLGVYYSFLYDLLRQIQTLIGFDKLSASLLNDLVIIRIMEPASKFRSIELMQTYFGIKHRRQNFYKAAPHWLLLKSSVEQVAVTFAQKEYAFEYDLLFYDVTTLYFETFENDDLRKQGFSKDNKSQQPQILVALMVSKEGFPIAYEVFSGNTFEGHTIIPAVQAFIQKNKVEKFTIIADAAMISAANIEELIKANINYVVGARLGNISQELLSSIDRQMIREDGKTIRLKTDKGYLICSYSSVRYRKDKYEMEKQLQKAQMLVDHPSKNKKVKFIKTRDEKLELNQALKEKSEKLLGIKGYYTDLPASQVSDKTIIERYHELYRIEQAFRVAKSDLQTRPIFHFKEEPIKLHLLICFMALVVSKHIELKTSTSIRRFLTDCKKITDARMLNTITNKEIKIKGKTNKCVEEYLCLLNLSH